jgi:hypothetical protein
MLQQCCLRKKQQALEAKFGLELELFSKVPSITRFIPTAVIEAGCDLSWAYTSHRRNRNAGWNPGSYRR